MRMANWTNGIMVVIHANEETGNIVAYPYIDKATGAKIGAPLLCALDKRETDNLLKLAQRLANEHKKDLMVLVYRVPPEITLVTHTPE